MNRSSLFRALLNTSAIVALGLAPAYAQDNTETDTDTAAESSDGDEVIVTGSRIRKNTFTSPVSMDVLDVEEAKIEGIADISGLLQTSTAASGSSQVTNAVSTAFVVGGGVGAETVGLRGLAANRTLDLINGRRAGPSGTRGSVGSFDLGSIPLVGVERVDILKDGASSVYGSDAIAGVINYITDKSDGAEIDLFTQIAEDGGGEIYRGSASFGKTFDRGRFRVTGDYYKAEELARRDRTYLDCNENYSFTDASLTTRADIIDPRTGNPQCAGTIWGHVWVYDYGRFFGAAAPNIAANPRNRIFQYSYPGDNLGNFVPAPPTTGSPFDLVAPAGWFQVEYNQSHIDNNPAFAGIDVSDNGPNAVTNLYPEMQRGNSVIPEVERITFMGDAEFELTDNITAYAEGLFNRRSNYVNGHQQYWTYQYGSNSAAPWFGGNNLFAPLATPVYPEWGGAGVWFSPTPVVDHGDEEVEIDYYRLVGGLKGNFGDSGPLKNWDWDVYTQYSDSHGEYTEQFVRNDSIRDFWFLQSSCAGQTSGGASGDVNGQTVTIAGRPCVDVRWFDPEFLAGNLTQAERDFLLDEDTGVTDFTQWTVEGYVTGDIVQGPAGAIQGAFGMFHQRDEITDRPSDTTLLGNEFFGSSAGITTGVQKTTALYGELSLPIVKDKPFFQDLSATVSGRYNEIKSLHEDGRSITVDGFNYRASLDWRLSEVFRLRASQGTSFRAPALFEQFLANESTGLRQNGNDPCIGWETGLVTGDTTQIVADNCAADGIPGDYAGAPISGTTLQGGGFGFLRPETSENFTIGAVVSPSFADLTIAVDYFDIEVKDEISTLSAFNILNGCYSSTNFANEPLCDLFLRARDDPDFGPTDTVPNRISKVFATFVNVNSQRNTGLDFTGRYRAETRFGDLSINAQATRQLDDEIDLLAESQTRFENGGIGEPKWTGFANFTLEPFDDFQVRYGFDYIGKSDGLKNLFPFSNGVPNTPDDIVNGVYTVQQDGQTVFWKTDTEAMFYHNMSVQYKMDGGWTFRAGVNNMFDEHPPANSAIATYGNTPVRSQYDLRGRRGFVNVSKTFN